MTGSNRRQIPLSPHRSRRQRGFVIIYLVIASFLLFGIVGLSIDSGRMYFKKRTMQAAADAGAIAAAFEIQRGNSSLMTQAAEHDASLNGVPASEVTVNYPPSAAAGTYAGNTRFVEVTVQENVPTTLLKLVGPEYGTVRAHAVAGGVQSGDYCMLALNRTASSALWIHGNDTLNWGAASCRTRIPAAGCGPPAVSASTPASSASRVPIPPMEAPGAFPPTRLATCHRRSIRSSISPSRPITGGPPPSTIRPPIPTRALAVPACSARASTSAAAGVEAVGTAMGMATEWEWQWRRQQRQRRRQLRDDLPARRLCL